MKRILSSLALVLVGACSMDPLGSRSSSDTRSAGDGTGTTTTATPCSPDACGPIPPVAPTPLCSDGSTGEVTTTCASDTDGRCTWHVQSTCPTAGAPDAGSPPSCGPDACGPVPPVAPSICADGSAATTTTTCAPAADGRCAWLVAQTCSDAGGAPDASSPPSCGPDACGPIPPVAPTPLCSDGSTGEVTTTCAPAADGRCTWHVQSTCTNAGAPDAGSSSCGPHTCGPDACGPIPPVAPSICSDGSVAATTAACAPDADGRCAWLVTQACPGAGH